MKFAYLFLTAFFISFLLTPLVKAIAGRAGVVAKPKEDRWHKNVIPLMGGVAIYAAFLIAYLVYLKGMKGGLGLLIGGTSIFLLGVADDLKGLSPQSKLVGQIVCASLTVISGVTINIIPSVLAIPLTILWIVGITNSFNLLDNMDGLSSGVAAIASLTVFACALALKNNEMAMFALILGGAALGFLPHNFHPAKIFMGDCGAMFLGFMLASITVMGTWKEASRLFLVLSIPVLALAVPIFDTIFVTVTRTIDGRSVAKGGKDHTSHRMVFLGWHERKAVTTLYLIALLFGLVAYASFYVKAYVSITVVTLLFIVVFSLGVFLSKMTRRKDEALPASPRDVAYYKNQSELIDALIKYKRVIFEVVCDLCLICIAYFSSYLIRYDGVVDLFNFGLIAKSLPIMIVIKLLAFSITGVYGNIWRYIGLNEILNIVKGVILGSLVSAAALVLAFRFEHFSRMIFLLDAMILLILMSAVRVAFRLFREQIFVSLDAKGKKILIFGAGDTGDAFLREVRKNKAFNYWPVGFVDDDLSKQGRRIQGVSVLGVRSDIPRLVEEHSIDEVIIAIPSACEKTKVDIEAICRESGALYHQVSGIYLR
ncbi:MAG: hypothetical protein PHR22_00630 [Candidatus Omnitrophica bacterium]|nr:hypothetical protein [Candidatus Omnitrophota bacterium]